MRRSITYRSLSLLLSIIVFLTFGLEASAKYYHDNTANIYVHKKTDKKIVALTFDDGPHEKKTEQILSILDKYKVKATFFVIGENAQKNPAILRKTYEAGHEIGNHTYDHKSIYKLCGDAVAEEVDKCSQVIESIIGTRPSLFRPPEGFMNDSLAKIVGDHGYNVILWKVDTYDWKGKSAQDIFTNVIKNIKNGDVILMHDYIWRESHTAQALDILIPYMLEQGYEFRTVSDLISD